MDEHHPLNRILQLITAIAGAYYVWKITDLAAPPTVDLKHFSLDTAPYDDYHIKPFKIDIPESDLIYLNQKLSTSRELPPPIMDVGFSYGINSEYLKNFSEYWKTEYKWKEREPYLNQFPQFTTQIGGLNIHFLHVKPDEAAAEGKEIFPLLLIHGWPASTRGFYKLIPMLTTPRDNYNFVFEVIAPTSPGNGFSEASQVEGLDPAQIAIMFHRLMSRLGFEKYFIHASDSGALIGQSLAIMLPQWILGYHSNVCVGITWFSLMYWFLSVRVPLIFLDGEREKTYEDDLWQVVEEGFFFHILGTMPDTIGAAMTDSPIALAAVILEKFSMWSNHKLKYQPDGGLELLDKNDLLDIIMIHWFTKSPAPSSRMWRDSFRLDTEYVAKYIIMREVTVAAGCVWFEHEVSAISYWSIKQTFTNLVTFKYIEDGGHFPAIEKPVNLSDDIWSFVNKAKGRPPKKRFKF